MTPTDKTRLSQQTYTPRGYVTTYDAAFRLFAARHPDLAASAFARYTEMQRLRSEIATVISRAGAEVDLARLGASHGLPLGTISGETVARLEELHCIQSEFLELRDIQSEASRLYTEAAVDLRTALAEGDLVAFLSPDETVPINKSRWRKDDGLAIVKNARLSDQVEGATTQPAESAVVIKEADLLGWISLISQTKSEANGDGPLIERGMPGVDGQPYASPGGPLEAQAQALRTITGRVDPLDSDDTDGTPPLTPAKRRVIDATIKRVYDEAPDDPPNIKKLPSRVHILLAEQHLSAKTSVITKIGEHPKHKARRRPVGTHREKAKP